MTEQEYKRMATLMQEIQQPARDAAQFTGNSLSNIKSTIDNFFTTYINPSLGVEKPQIYNDENLKSTLPMGNLLLGNSDKFFTDISQGQKTNPIDAIDAATLFPIAGLAGKGIAKGGSKLLSRIFDKPIGKPTQPNINFFDRLNNSSVFEKQAIKTKNINPDAKIYHDHNTVDGVIKNLVPYENDLNITLSKVAEKSSPKAEISTRTKLPEKINVKLDAGKNPENISDVMGGRIAVNSADEIPQVLKELDNNANIIKIDNYYDPIGLEVSGHRDGYRAVHVQILNSKGATAEVQIIPKAYLPINDAGKNYYNALRHKQNLNPVSNITNSILNKNSKFQRDALFKKLQNNPKNNLTNIAPIFPTYRGLLSE